MDKALKPWLIILTIISLLFTMLFAISVIFNFTYSLQSEVKWENTGQIGDFFGGIVGTFVAGIGSLLLYITFKSQQKEFINSQIESRFFELLKLHKENLTNIVYENEADDKSPKLKDRKAIQFIIGQVESCFREIGRFFDDKKIGDILQDEFLTKSQKLFNNRSAIDQIQLARIDIAYSIVFHGLSRKDHNSLQKLFARHYKEEFTKWILLFVRLKGKGKDKLTQWNMFYYKKISTQELIADLKTLENNEKVMRRSDDPTYALLINGLWQESRMSYKFYGGHQYKLGHYFRHLFQTVKYINTVTTLTYAEKYDYVKTLRAQLSTVEQYLFFLNSVSFMGRAWEFDYVDSNVSDYNLNKWLITKYNFIKNLPDLVLFDEIDISNYYPLIHYEFEEKPDNYEKLIVRFRHSEGIKINK